MLTPFQQAVIDCLTDIDQHAHFTYPWPGPTLLAVLRETPVLGHPDPTARHVEVAPMPAPVPPGAWEHPDGPAAALRQVAAELYSPFIQATIAAATGRVRLVAWVLMHTRVIVDDDYQLTRVRYVDAVDLDGTAYTLTRRRAEAPGPITVDDRPDTDDPTSLIGVLRSLARLLPRHPC